MDGHLWDIIYSIWCCPMILWITTVGWSPFAALNTLWGACLEKEIVPNRVIVLSNSEEKSRVKKNLEIFSSWCERVIQSFGIEPVIETRQVRDNDIDGYANIVRELIDEFNPEYDIAIWKGSQHRVPFSFY